MGTVPVWTINKDDKNDWEKNHRSDATLIKKFKKFETSVTGDPYTTNPDVDGHLNPPLTDIMKYKKGGRKGVRGLYKIDQSNAEIGLIEFDYRGNIKTYK